MLRYNKDLIIPPVLISSINNPLPWYPPCQKGVWVIFWGIITSKKLKKIFMKNLMK